MKKRCCALALLICGLLPGISVAQKSAVDYMQKVETAQSKVTEDFLIYVSAVAHGKSARKVDKRRKDLLSAVSQARSQMKHLVPFEKTDTTLRAAAFTYLNILYVLLKEDYGKIVDMEEIAEQSYDNMEAYLNIQEEANKKLEDAGDRLEAATKTFAADNNVTLLEQKDAMSKKAEKVETVNKYYHKIYLIYFKSMKQEAYMIAALDKKDVNAVEQNKNALLKNSEEGLAKLIDLKGFENDQTLVADCKKLLQFYQKEATEKMPVLVDFMLKNQTFVSAKSKFDSGSKSKEDTDAYNKAVAAINDAGATYNKTNAELNQTRSKLNTDWDNGVKNFMDKHIPQSK